MELPEHEYVQAYGHGLKNLVFSRKLAQSESANVNELLSITKKFIHADDYVRWKRELDNKVKEYIVQRNLSQ